MESLEKDIQMAPDNEDRSDSEDTRGEGPMTVDDREDEDDDARHPYDQYEDEVMADVMLGETTDDGNVELQSDEDEDDRQDEIVTVGGVQYPVGKKRKKEQQGIGTEIAMGETVTAGEYTWTRIEGVTEDTRKEPHFETSFKTNLFNEQATEVDVFRALMPLSRTTLLNIVRDNADKDGDGTMVAMAY
jgi:hypothetical protein